MAQTDGQILSESNWTQKEEGDQHSIILMVSGLWCRRDIYPICLKIYTITEYFTIIKFGPQLIVELKTMQMEGQSPFHGIDRDQEDSKLLF